MTVITDSAAKTADADTPVGITVGIKGVMKDVLFKTRHICRLSLLKAICLGFPFFAMAIALDSAAESIREDGLTSGLVGKTRLTSTQITRLFSDVIDRGEVQDRRGISAETLWYANGTFVSQWWKEASHEGSVKQEVTGRWRAERDLRCVAFGSGARIDWSCAEVWLLDDGRVLSLNPDGSTHGLHRLSTLKR